MKIKRFAQAFAAFALLAGGGVAALSGVKSRQTSQVNATDYGTITITGLHSASSASAFYLLYSGGDGLPVNWDDRYSPVDNNSGIYINGVRQSSYDFKHPNIGIDTFYYGMPVAAVEGDVVEFKGTFTNSKSGATFTLNHFARRYNGSAWDYALEDYDVISFQDANMPDFESGNINTEDASGYGYVGINPNPDTEHGETPYSNAKKVAPKRRGLFGLTNETLSYAFQFNFSVTGTMSNWVEIRIGASGGWATGHVLKYQFTNQWNDGVLIVSERIDDTVYNSHTKEVRTNIEDGTRLMECGAIKVLGDNNLYYVYFKNNGIIAFSDYWELSSQQRSTKVGIYAPDTCISLTNSIVPSATRLTLSDSSTATALYFNTSTDVLSFVHTWEEYFIPQDNTSFTYNGVDASNQINYFKKVGATQNAFFLGFGDLGITPAKGDVFHLGGIFKLVRFINDVAVLYKVKVQSCDFQFDGTKWSKVNPNYEASDFAKDLLKLTRPVCSAAQSGNHDALASVWAVLADEDHFAALFMAEKDIIKFGTPDNTVVVPSTDAEIDEMLPEDAIGAALYRYDYCDAKYNLGNFIDRTITVSFASNSINTIQNDSNSMMIVIIVTSIMSISVLGILLVKKRQIRVNK